VRQSETLDRDVRLGARAVLGASKIASREMGAERPDDGVKVAEAAPGEGRPETKDARSAPRAMPRPPPVRTSPLAETPTVESAALDASAEVSSPGRRSSARAVADALAERVGSVASTSRAPSRRLPVWEYIQAELGLTVGAREHDPDMAVARERVFDIIWYIPREFERLNLYGGALCADAILGVVTSLPVRVLCQTARLVVVPWESRWRKKRAANEASPSRSKKPWGFHPYAREHLSDSLWLFILAGAVIAAGHVDVSVLYHYIRGQEVIKLYLACSVLECFDKLCSAFNCHVLDAAQNSVFLVVSASARSETRGAQFIAWAQLFFDTGLALATTTAHTLILLTHAVTLSVAINSHTNAMLLVLISNNFGEIKGHVFKKMDDAKVFTAARMDIVERVHLSVQLLFVAAQRVTASGSVVLGLDRKLLKDSMMVLGSEIGVDVFKHAFISKFNGLRPRVYRGFFRQLCREHVKLAQSYKLHRVVGFVPLAPAAVLLKTLPGLYRTFGAGAGGGAPLFLGVGRDVLAFGRDALRSAMRSALTRVGLETFEDVAAFAERDASVEERESLSFPFVGFALLFAFLVVFKLAFGVALHWFGAHMLDTLPKDVGGGRRERERESAASRVSSPARDEPEPPNPWRNPGTRVLFEQKPERRGVSASQALNPKEEAADARRDAALASASTREEDGGSARIGASGGGDGDGARVGTRREKTENGHSPRFADAVRARSSGNGTVWMRGDNSCSSSLPFGGEGEEPNETKRADSLLTAGLNNREARANPATATPAPAPGSPKRASLDVPFTPGSPHYKLYPDYKAG
jgi:hypothetical protein